METTKRPDCPHLPPAQPGLSYRELSRHGGARDGGFYVSALRYAQCLWLRNRPARAILALTRGLYADLRGDESELVAWPMPYAALAWILCNERGDAFLGNPRISYQHQAGRMRGPRLAVRNARAWAAWAIVRQVRPELPGDAGHPIEEPQLETIAAALDRFGVPGERSVWARALKEYSDPRVRWNEAVPRERKHRQVRE